MRTLKRIAIFASLLILFGAFTQSDSTWTLLIKKDGFSISQKSIYEVSSGVKTFYKVFKYENENNFDISASWRTDLYVNGQCRSCGLSSPNEYEKTIQMKAKEKMEYSAKQSGNLYKVLDYIETNSQGRIEKIEITNLNITK